MQGICQDKPLQQFVGGKGALDGVEKGWKESYIPYFLILTF